MRNWMDGRGTFEWRTAREKKTLLRSFSLSAVCVLAAAWLQALSQKRK